MPLLLMHFHCHMAAAHAPTTAAAAAHLQDSKHTSVASSAALPLLLT
jgi:hypothetical protein